MSEFQKVLLKVQFSTKIFIKEGRRIESKLISLCQYKAS